MRTTFQVPVATGFLLCGASVRDTGLQLRDNELIISVTVMAIICIIAVASIVVCCTIAFVSFPSSRIDVYEGRIRKT